MSSNIITTMQPPPPPPPNVNGNNNNNNNNLPLGYEQWYTMGWTPIDHTVAYTFNRFTVIWSFLICVNHLNNNTLTSVRTYKNRIDKFFTNKKRHTLWCCQRAAFSISALSMHNCPKSNWMCSWADALGDASVFSLHLHLTCQFHWMIMLPWFYCKCHYGQ